MRCCSSAAIPKISRLETRFFAHKNRASCQSAPESAEHLKAKAIIAESARAAGWQTFTEESGTNLDGSPWIADVLCARGNVKVAFEIQLAAQTPDEYRSRQKRYARSDVRCLWLARKGSVSEHLRPSRGLPLVIINVQDSANMTVEVESSSAAPPIPLADFVKGALGGDLFWAEAGPGRVAVELQIASIACWKCRKPIKAARGYVINNHFVPLAEVSDTETLATFLLELHKSDPEVTRVSQRYSRTTQDHYFAAACPFCAALLGDWFMTADFFTEVVTNCEYPDCGCPDAPHFGREIGCRVFAYRPITLRLGSELSGLPRGEWLWRPFTRGASRSRHRQWPGARWPHLKFRHKPAPNLSGLTAIRAAPGLCT